MNNQDAKADKERKALKRGKPQKAKKPQRPQRRRHINVGPLYYPEDLKDPNFQYQWEKENPMALREKEMRDWIIEVDDNGDPIVGYDDRQGTKTLVLMKKLKSLILEEKNEIDEERRFHLGEVGHDPELLNTTENLVKAGFKA